MKEKTKVIIQLFIVILKILQIQFIQNTKPYLKTNPQYLTISNMIKVIDTLIEKLKQHF